MFDQLYEEQGIRTSLSRKDLYNVWDLLSKRYERGEIPKQNYQELRDLMYDKMSVLKMLEDFINGKS